jgi:hypothetical protein
VKALILSALLAAQAAMPATASDGVRTTGLLTDTDFLRLVTCGAAPDGPCQIDPATWPDPGNLTIAFGPVPDGYSTEKAAQIGRALDDTITSINNLSTAVTLRRTTDVAAAQIILRPTLLRENDRVRDEPGVPDGEPIGVGYVYVTWDADRRLTRGTILISQDIAPAEVTSVVLEEVTQSLGFLFDIDNPAYEYVSIFAQNSNAVQTLTGQDAAVLRLYYPN